MFQYEGEVVLYGKNGGSFHHLKTAARFLLNSQRYKFNFGASEERGQRQAKVEDETLH
jgi:hypothetical protein